MFPNDADGDALRRVANAGSNMALPMEIDFFVAVPDRTSGEAISRVASLQGFRTDLVEDESEETNLADEDCDGGHSWTCYCSKRMLATYDGVVQVQFQLAELSRPFGGQTDGWGTHGNVEPAEPGAAADRGNGDGLPGR